jgi:hypothetical protein
MQWAIGAMFIIATIITTTKSSMMARLMQMQASDARARARVPRCGDLLTKWDAVGVLGLGFWV